MSAAFRVYGTAVQEDDLLCDRQPQARAAGVGDAGLVQPVKFIKEQGKLFRGNVVPLVLRLRS